MNHQNIWAPWRTAYVRELGRRTRELDAPADAPRNFFGMYWAHPEDDEANHVVFRDGHGMILLNRYPYANGHLLVALGEPRPTLGAYEPGQRAALWHLIEFGLELVERALNPQGVNIGINQGNAAGAGLPEHLHAHIVPRWAADTNFMTVVAQVRVIPDSLEASAERYRKVLREMGERGRGGQSPLSNEVDVDDPGAADGKG